MGRTGTHSAGDGSHLNSAGRLLHLSGVQQTQTQLWGPNQTIGQFNYLGKWVPFFESDNCPNQKKSSNRFNKSTIKACHRSSLNIKVVQLPQSKTKSRCHRLQTPSQFVKIQLRVSDGPRVFILLCALSLYDGLTKYIFSSMGEAALHNTQKCWSFLQRNHSEVSDTHLGVSKYNVCQNWGKLPKKGLSDPKPQLNQKTSFWKSTACIGGLQDYCCFRCNVNQAFSWFLSDVSDESKVYRTFWLINH